MDNFHEEIVVRHKRGLYSFLYALCWVFMVIFALLALNGLTGAMNILSGQIDSTVIISIVFLVVFGGGTFLLWRHKDELRCEYDYTFTNGDLDIAKVLNNTRRKALTSLSMRNVEACGAINHASFQRYLTMRDIKKYNWFLNRESNLYYFYFTKNSVKYLIIVELSDEMIAMVRSHNYLNFGVWQG